MFFWQIFQLRSRDPQRRTQALSQLATPGNHRAIKHILKNCALGNITFGDSKDALIRIDAKWSTTQEAAVTALELTSLKEYPTVPAIQLLGEIPGPRQFEEIVDFVGFNSPKFYIASLESLSKLASIDPHESFQAIIRSMAQMIYEPDFNRRQKAIQTLANLLRQYPELPVDFQPIFGVLKNKDVVAKQQAISTLSEVGQECENFVAGFVDSIAECLADTDGQVIEAAINALKCLTPDWRLLPNARKFAPKIRNQLFEHRYLVSPERDMMEDKIRINFLDEIDVNWMEGWAEKRDALLKVIVAFAEAHPFAEGVLERFDVFLEKTDFAISMPIILSMLPWWDFEIQCMRIVRSELCSRLLVSLSKNGRNSHKVANELLEMFSRVPRNEAYRGGIRWLVFANDTPAGSIFSTLRKMGGRDAIVPLVATLGHPNASKREAALDVLEDIDPLWHKSQEAVEGFQCAVVLALRYVSQSWSAVESAVQHTIDKIGPRIFPSIISLYVKESAGNFVGRQIVYCGEKFLDSEELKECVPELLTAFFQRMKTHDFSSSTDGLCSTLHVVLQLIGKSAERNVLLNRTRYNDTCSLEDVEQIVRDCLMEHIGELSELQLQTISAIPDYIPWNRYGLNTDPGPQADPDDRVKRNYFHCGAIKNLAREALLGKRQ